MIFLEFLKKHAVLSALLPALFLSNRSFAQQTLGITGGGDNIGTAPACVTIVESSTTVGVPISLSVPTGVINSVSINTSSLAIVGGQDLAGSAPAYAAFVSSSGVATSTDLGLSSGVINSVAINDSSKAIVGGQDLSGSAPPYLALISPKTAPSPIIIPMTAGIIKGVDINPIGEAIVGGQDLSGATPAYAARVSPSGALTPIAGLPTSGIIRSVSINGSNKGIIGGEDLTGAQPPYAALISSDGAVTSLALGPASGRINSVDINDSGKAVVGGTDFTGSQPAYVAFISPSGAVTPIPLGLTTATITSVAINDTGRAIVGGQNISGFFFAFEDPSALVPLSAYAALITPSGDVIPLSLDISAGIINSVAINEFNQSIVGGQSASGAAYLAIVSPSGEVTQIITGLINGFINSVAILSNIPTSTLSGNNLSFASYINENAPQNAFYFVPAFFDGTLSEALESAAPTRNAISLYTASNNLFYLNHSLSSHLRNNAHFRSRASSNNAAQVALGSSDIKADELTASLNDEIAWQGHFRKEKPSAQKNRPYTFWFEGIGALSYQKAQKQTVAFNPTTGAAILGFDAVINQKSWVGGGAAYSYTQIHEKKDAGYSHINQEYLFAYGAYQGCRFYLDAALWGGLFQIDQVRKIHMTGFEFKSTSHPHGWQLAPHLELGYNAVSGKNFIVDPFVMADWVSAWQDSYKEKGSGPFNAGQKHHYSSLLRTEAGLRLYETLNFEAWRLTFQEKASYVYKKPFRVGRVNAFLVGSPGSFTVETLTTPQNLGVGEFAMIFEPTCQRYPYGSITYQGEFGSSSQAHQVCLELAWNF